jgi:hypothetical protein
MPKCTINGKETEVKDGLYHYGGLSKIWGIHRSLLLSPWTECRWSVVGFVFVKSREILDRKLLAIQQ